MKSRREFFGYVLMLLLAAYALAPRGWEPGGETLKNWVAARVFRQTSGFPVLYYAPLYNMYLQIFLFFKYPMSIQLEHLITHLFAYTCIFLLLCRFLPRISALLLTCAWIPLLWTIEGGARIAGIGFLALYFRPSGESIIDADTEYLPIPLMAAGFIDTAFLLFLVGHMAGMAIKRYRRKEPLFFFASSLSPKTIFSGLIKTAAILLLILTLSFQSKRSDNIVHAYDYPWTPFPQKEVLTSACLQIGNWKYVTRTMPEEEWIHQDFYFTNKEAFGGAKSILEAAFNRPKVFFENIRSNLYEAGMTPLYFIVGFRPIPSAFVRIFVLTSWILLFAALYRIFRYYRANGLTPHIYSIIFGSVGIIAALLLVWFATRYVITLLPVVLLAVGSLCKGIRPWIVNTIILTMSACIVMSVNPYGEQGPIQVLSRNPFLLSGRMAKVHKQLLASVNKKTKVLALEEPWVRAFADIDLDKVYHALYLPPFEDKRGETEKFLEGLDVIWVSDNFARKEPSVATQVYLRYQLHVEPFLKKALKNGWTVQEVKGFGKIYRKKGTA